MNPEQVQPSTEHSKEASPKDNVVAKKIYQQFVQAREWYKQASEQDRPKIKQRFLDVFNGADDLFDAFLDAESTPDIEPFLLAAVNSPAVGPDLERLMAGRDHDGKAGILQYELKPLEEGTNRLVMHMPPLELESGVQGAIALRRQLKESFAALRKVVEADPSIKEIAGYTWLFTKPGADRLLPKGFEKTKAKAADDDEPGFRGAQRSALFYDADALKTYLFEGKKPMPEGRMITRDKFLAA